MKNNKFDSAQERDFYLRFFSKYQSKTFFLERAISPHDFTLYSNGLPLAIVEVVGDWMFGKPGMDAKVRKLVDFSKRQAIAYLLISDGNRATLWIEGKRSGKVKSIDEAWRFLLRVVATKSEVSKSEIDQAFRKALGELDGKGKFEASKYLENIVVEGNQATFGAFEDSQRGAQIEDEFFSDLLGAEVPEYIYRYTGWNSTFLMLEKESIRMNGLVGMNDTSETHYADRYLGITDTFETIPESSLDDINRRFIVSCSCLGDDLTMWRLYAEDGAGAVSKLKVKDEIPPGFYIKRVSYGSLNGSHLELDVLRKIRELFAKKGLKFLFRRFHIWKHFFKPAAFKVEEEVRILYVQSLNDLTAPKTEWGLTTSHSILNPFVVHPLHSLPIIIEEVSLGFKLPERKVNERQVETFLRERLSAMQSSSLSGVLVTNSSISTYR